MEEQDDKKQDNVQLFGKIAKFPKNVKAKNALTFLENVKISKQKLWYFLIERDTISQTGTDHQLHMIKYNNKVGVDCTQFLTELKSYYTKDEQMKNLVEQLIIDGNDKFSCIRNIPDVEIEGEKFINKITKDLKKLLY
jgi:hypothetical protein